MYTISWDDDQEQIGSADGVELLLDRLHESRRNATPMLVTVERKDTGDSLSIGLGCDLSVLNYVNGNKNPPYYTSSGGSLADEAISFMFGGEWSEYPMRNALPIAVARSAMKHFCETGGLASNITWEEA